MPLKLCHQAYFLVIEMKPRVSEVLLKKVVLEKRRNFERFENTFLFNENAVNELFDEVATTAIKLLQVILASFVILLFIKGEKAYWRYQV